MVGSARTAMARAGQGVVHGVPRDPQPARAALRAAHGRAMPSLQAGLGHGAVSSGRVGATFNQLCDGRRVGVVVKWCGGVVVWWCGGVVVV